jgi:hypothetical protein
MGHGRLHQLFSSRQEAEDGQTDGLQFFPVNVVFFVLWTPKAARFESAVQYCPPTVPRIVAVYVR